MAVYAANGRSHAPGGTVDLSVSELQTRLGIPRKVTISAETWLAAAVLGSLRTAVNDEHRGRSRDRGTLKNRLNDIQGSLGELVGLELLHRAGLGLPLSGLLDLQGSVDRPDLVAGTNPSTALDVKCHFDEPQKQLFLVNEQARMRSMRRGVQAFLPVVTARLHRDAYLGALIPIEAVEAWELRTLGDFKDPARLLHLTALDEQFLGHREVRWSQPGVASQWGPVVLGEQSLVGVEETINASLLRRLRKRGFTLDGIDLREARESLLTLLPLSLRPGTREAAD